MKPEWYLARFSDILDEKKHSVSSSCLRTERNINFQTSRAAAISRDSSVGIQTRLKDIREARV
jgi:hypothetical protein